MELTATQKKAQELLNTLIVKTWEDPEFKERLIANPLEEIKKATGKKIETHKKVFVVDQSNPDHIYINIPVRPNLDNIELTEDQLEMIAGGVPPLEAWLSNPFQAAFDWGFEIGSSMVS
ncbi:NHLP leader peptide family RiPP precursor [Aquimarina sp. 2201CG1-2-11]|uniref:NHLP leader peptide family RiPP precursor n=1 Tax=Aquimarina discodermiae TaxID=3231043 RepID=UPI0034635BDB